MKFNINATGSIVRTHEELEVGKKTTRKQYSWPAVIDKIEYKNRELKVYLTRKDK